MRDSWFAGFTGEHLAVFWMGRDDNKPTTLFGASGGLRAWRELFAKLPTRPLSAAPGAGLEMAWINPADSKRTESQCEGAQQVPIVAGSLPATPKAASGRVCRACSAAVTIHPPPAQAGPAHATPGTPQRN